MESNDRPSVRAARAAAFLARHFEHDLNDIGLSLPQYRLLAFLSAGDRAASRLAEHLAVSRPSITALVDGLAERGLVERRQSPDDRRRVLHQLTPAGAATLAAADDRLAGTVDDLSSRLDDPDTVIDGLGRLADALESSRREVATR